MAEGGEKAVAVGPGAATRDPAGERQALVERIERLRQQDWIRK